jgi:hypothetical protein
MHENMLRPFGSTVKGRMFAPKVVDMVWDKAAPLPGEDPDVIRADACGARIRRRDCNLAEARLGWEIDHITPVAEGGTDDLDNLQPLHWENNRAKKDSPWTPWQACFRHAPRKSP